MSIIRIDDLTFAYEGAPETVFRGLTLELDDTWKLALTGRNGRGKTTLLKLLSGELDARGRIHAAARFARFPFAVEDASLPARAAMAAVCGAEDWRIERVVKKFGGCNAQKFTNSKKTGHGWQGLSVFNTVDIAGTLA